MIVVAKVVITKEDRDNFKATINGRRKYCWLVVGWIVDFISSILVCLLIAFSGKIYDPMVFYFLLYLLLIVMVIGGESIGVYYGALEQYVLNKKEKKAISYME